MTAPAKPRATVRIRLTVELEADGVWGGDCPISQVHKQGLDAVKHALRVGLTIEGQTQKLGTKRSARIIGEPTFIMTVVEEPAP